MDFRALSIHVRGLTMHVQQNPQGIDKNNPFTVAIAEITNKGKKQTAEDRVRLADLEWERGLYLDADRRVVVPGNMVRGAYIEAARKQRKGTEAKAGILCAGDWPLLYDGPKDVDALRADPNFRLYGPVTMPKSGTRVMRTRPCFRSWELKYVVQYRADMLSREDMELLTRILFTDVGLSENRTDMGGRGEVVLVREYEPEDDAPARNGRRAALARA